MPAVETVHGGVPPMRPRRGMRANTSYIQMVTDS